MAPPYNEIYFSSTHRSSQKEIMDDFNFQGEEMRVLLNDLARVNALLGGKRITKAGFSILLKNIPKSETVILVDLGCGDGEMLRTCSDYGTRLGYQLKCIGIDANEHILSTAKNRSLDYQNITFRKLDVTSPDVSWPKMDIVLCTLFLHHFSSEEIRSMLHKIAEKTKVGIVINDLERSRWAFRLFQVFSRLFLKTNTAKYDGLVSIARGFKRNELKNLSEEIRSMTSSIHWKWAFRYQMILKKKEI